MRDAEPERPYRPTVMQSGLLAGMAVLLAVALLAALTFVSDSMLALVLFSLVGGASYGTAMKWLLRRWEDQSLDV